MSLAALNRLTQRTAAAFFSRNESGEPLCAWFPADAASKPEALAGYTVYAGPVADGPMKIKTKEALGLHLSTDSTRSLSLPPLSYTPKKGTTTLLIGYCLTDTTTPDPARVERYRIEEYRTAPGNWEIDAVRIAPLTA